MNANSTRVGIIGAGFLAETRARCYRRVFGPKVELVAVAARSIESAGAFARRWSIRRTFDDYHEMLELGDVDVIDVCTPNRLHAPMVLAAIDAGKHVICTKPLTGYFGLEGDTEDVGTVPKRRMFAYALRDATALVTSAEQRGVHLCYAENWVYAPAIQKAQRLIEASQGSILEIRGAECHSGSHSHYSHRWSDSGGGALSRLASHPVGAALYLKRVEGMARSGYPIAPVFVTAELGRLNDAAAGVGARGGWLAGGWHDVEDWGTLIVTFDDGTKAVLTGSDVQLGGLSSGLELSLSNARIVCKLSPTDLCQAYAPDGSIFGHEPLIEKLETAAGSSLPSPDEAWTHGQLQQIQDFMEAIAFNRPPLADGALGRQVVEVIYAAYVAAEEGRRVDIRALASQT